MTSDRNWVKETTIVEHPASDPVTFFDKDGKPLITIQIGPSKGVTTTYRRADPEQPAGAEAVSDAWSPQERALVPCDGSRRCKAARHVHGCLADHGNCDRPDEHQRAENGQDVPQ